MPTFVMPDTEGDDMKNHRIQTVPKHEPLYCRPVHMVPAIPAFGLSGNLGAAPLKNNF